jgi:hypothetical protein
MNFLESIHSFLTANCRKTLTDVMREILKPYESYRIGDTKTIIKSPEGIQETVTYNWSVSETDTRYLAEQQENIQLFMNYIQSVDVFNVIIELIITNFNTWHKMVLEAKKDTSIFM